MAAVRERDLGTAELLVNAHATAGSVVDRTIVLVAGTTQLARLICQSPENDVIGEAMQAVFGGPWEVHCEPVVAQSADEGDVGHDHAGQQRAREVGSGEVPRAETATDGPDSTGPIGSAREDDEAGDHRETPDDLSDPSPRETGTANGADGSGGLTGGGEQRRSSQADEPRRERRPALTAPPNVARARHEAAAILERCRQEGGGPADVPATVGRLVKVLLAVIDYLEPREHDELDDDPSTSEYFLHCAVALIVNDLRGCPTPAQPGLGKDESIIRLADRLRRVGRDVEHLAAQIPSHELGMCLHIYDPELCSRVKAGRSLTEELCVRYLPPDVVVPPVLGPDEPGPGRDAAGRETGPENPDAESDEEPLLADPHRQRGGFWESLRRRFGTASRPPESPQPPPPERDQAVRPLAGPPIRRAVRSSDEPPPGPLQPKSWNPHTGFRY